jgi:hypothetical protein
MAKRSFRRPPPNRNLRKVYVIATEGKCTEPLYFQCFQGNPYRQNLSIKLLPARKGQSAPKSVLKRLQEYAKKSGLKPQDELWLVIDVPEWTTADLQAVYQACQKEGYSLAASNPSFELWLLLHQENPRTPSTVSECERELTRLLGKPYDKSNYDPHRLLPKVDHAIAHAQRLHTDDAEPWPPSVGTQVYKLVAHLIASPTPATSP